MNQILLYYSVLGFYIIIYYEKFLKKSGCPYRKFVKFETQYSDIKDDLVSILLNKKI